MQTSFFSGTNRRATSVICRDLLLSAAQLDVDKLDFTVDEKWLTPLQQWLSHTFGAGQALPSHAIVGLTQHFERSCQGGFDLFGVVAEELLNVAGKPITEAQLLPSLRMALHGSLQLYSCLDRVPAGLSPRMATFRQMSRLSYRQKM